MTYIKLFIDVAKKQVGNKNPEYYGGLEKRIREIFKEPLGDLFDKPDIVLTNFEEFYAYYQDYYNNLLNKGIRPGPEHIDDAINQVMETDKNDELQYYKKLFLLEFLGSKIDYENNIIKH